MVVASAGESIRTLVTLATIWTVAAQVLFVANFFASLWSRKTMDSDNPWAATTLEWSVGSPVPEENFGGRTPVVYRGAYEFAPQHLSPELLAQKAQ